MAILWWCQRCVTVVSHISDYPFALTGSIRFQEELIIPENGGLSKAIVMLTRIKNLHPLISWADLIQMAGALSVELAGGPKIDMLYGRVDCVHEDYHVRVMKFSSVIFLI